MTTTVFLVSLFGLSLTNLHNFGYEEERVLSFGDEVTSQATEYLKAILSGKWLHPSNIGHLHKLFMERTFLISALVYLSLTIFSRDQVGQVCDYLSANYQGMSHLYLLALAASVLLFALFSMKVRFPLLEELLLRMSQALVLSLDLMFILIFFLPMSAIGFVILSIVLCTAYVAKALGGVGLLGFFLSALGFAL